jgi:ATP-dependent Clp protease ATP-binding subunit ClpC
VSIIELELNKVRLRLSEHDLKLELSPDAKEFLIDKGTSADFGARPLRRAIEQFVEDPLSEDILRGTFLGKNLIRVGVKMEGDVKQHLTFEAIAVDDGSGKSLAASDAT